MSSFPLLLENIYFNKQQSDVFFTQNYGSMGFHTKLHSLTSFRLFIEHLAATNNVKYGDDSARIERNST